jgi:hypothetical protein
MRADVEYLGRNHRRQDSELEDLAVEEIHSFGPGRFEVRTRERWLIRMLWSKDGSPAEPPRRQEIRAAYQVSAEGDRFRVEGWDFQGPGS